MIDTETINENVIAVLFCLFWFSGFVFGVYLKQIVAYLGL